MLKISINWSWYDKPRARTIEEGSLLGDSEGAELGLDEGDSDGFTSSEHMKISNTTATENDMTNHEHVP